MYNLAQEAGQNLSKIWQIWLEGQKKGRAKKGRANKVFHFTIYHFTQYNMKLLGCAGGKHQVSYQNF